MQALCFMGNLLWFTVGLGFITGTAWLLASLICFCSIIGMPFGFACARIAVFAYFPFGKELVPAELVGEARIPGTALMNVLWIVFVGIWLSIDALVTGISQCLTIVGIPFGLANFKLCVASFAPLGMRVVPGEVAAAARARAAQAALPTR